MPFLEPHKVRLVVQALIKEGFVKTRKQQASSTQGAYYWVSPKEIKTKVKHLLSDIDLQLEKAIE